MRSRLMWGTAALLPILALAAWSLADRGDPALHAFVADIPGVDVVFTSRSTAASFEAAAPDGAQYVYPGKPLWQSPQGRLRLLSSRGTVRELTWNKPLPDGGKLIDVMSPAITPDARKVIFSGRRNDDHGHFRLYEVGLDGRGLQALTGGANDPGCMAVPPMRWQSEADQQLLPDALRRRTDYDDLDPAPLPDGRIAFISSRVPDLGRDHARRATNLWMREADGRMHPLSANRNNDRWPFLTTTGQLIFSHWSRNREVVSADGRDIIPWQANVSALTAPTDDWMAALVAPAGDRFGHFAKTPWPAWRPRMLFNGRMVCMTRFDDQSSLSHDAAQPLYAVQIEPGLIHNAPSALADGDRLPAQTLSIQRGPAQDKQGRRLETATPAPFPPAHIVFSGRPLATAGRSHMGGWALYLVSDDWSANDTSQPVEMRLLFDDPKMVDAEPVAAYPKQVVEIDADIPRSQVAVDPVRLSDGSLDRGPAAYVDNAGVFTQQNEAAPGQTTDRGEGPIFTAPPQNTIERLRMYASQRDRFDDPQRPRIAGEWRTLLEIPLAETGRVAGWIPIQQPTVLAGLDSQGRVAQWTTSPQDSHGRQATFFAYAGDHYSGGKPGGITMCLGCHPGHSGIGYRRGNRDHRER